MDRNASAAYTALNSIQAIGRGFDVNCDTRLLYCKGSAGSRLVEIDEHTKDLYIHEDLMIPNVSRDIKCSELSDQRKRTGVYSFHEMVEYFNKKAGLSGNVPVGSFNSAFNFSGSKQIDAAATKCLAMDEFCVHTFKIELTRSSLVLKEHVKQAVPSSWDPLALASFIENFGTHIITSVTIGGKDCIYVKQHSSSSLSAKEIKDYVHDIGEQRFSEMLERKSSGPIKSLDPSLFNSSGIYPQPPSAPYLTGKEDVTVIFRRRGGDDLVQKHTDWVKTVGCNPDVIDLTFCPTFSLLNDKPGKEHIERAICLYLDYKPPIEELRCFLEFQVPRIWAPVQDHRPGHQRKEPVCPSLQFSLMSPKLYVSPEQISVGRRPVTGLRLRLEGLKQNRLCIHVQYLASLPKIFRPYWDSHIAIGPPKWHGPEEQDSRWFEPIRWKNFSHISTCPIEKNETFIGDLSGVHVVTGAQLGVWDFGSKNVLYMKLLYSRVPGCTIRRSLWDHTPLGSSKSLESGESSSRPKDSTNKLAKLVDMSDMSKGPQDSPGHWLVTGGKLGVEKGKIVLRVKYSLLNY